MKMMNEAIEGARDFQGFMEKIVASDRQARQTMEPKREPAFSATPNIGFCQRVDKTRAKAKAAAKARATQRMRAKGKR
jgi:hypothetical protein